jgi:hypothetical protein
MRKLEALKIRWVQEEEEEKNTFYELENFFFLAILSLLLFICTSKTISRA